MICLTLTANPTEADTGTLCRFVAKHPTATADPLRADSEMALHVTRTLDEDDINNDNDEKEGNVDDCVFEGDEGKAATNLAPCVRALHASFCSGQECASHARFCAGFDLLMGSPSGCHGGAPW